MNKITLHIFEDKEWNVWASEEQPEDWMDMKLRTIKTFTSAEVKEILYNGQYSSIRWILKNLV